MKRLHEDRPLVIGEKVTVHKHLPRQDAGEIACWAVTGKCPDGKKRIIAYVSELTIKVTKFKVTETMRQKALVTKRSVHAHIEGIVVATDHSLDRHLTYIPAVGPTFFDCQTKEPLTTKNTETVTFKNYKVYR